MGTYEQNTTVIFSIHNNNKIVNSWVCYISLRLRDLNLISELHIQSIWKDNSHSISKKANLLCF